MWYGAARGGQSRKTIIMKDISKVSELKENHEMLEKDANAKIDAATASSGLRRTMVIVILVKIVIMTRMVCGINKSQQRKP